MMQIFSGASSGAWFEKAQRFGKSFMLPIAVLPAAGVVVGDWWGSVESQYVDGLPILECRLAAGNLHNHDQRRFYCVCQPVGTLCGRRRRGAGEIG